MPVLDRFQAYRTRIEVFERYGKYIYQDAGLKRTHGSWQGLKERCNNKKLPSYKSYGGRGIKYQASWENFIGFLDDMGVAEKGMSIERIDVNGNYCKENCKWIPVLKQQDNKRCSLRLTYKGEKYTLTELCEAFQLNREKANTRRKRGWSVEDLVIGSRRSRVTFEGVIYTYKELAKKLDISTVALQHRLKNEWTEAEIKRGFQKRGLIHENTYYTLTQLAEKLKIDYEFFLRRFNKGLSVDEIAIQYLNRKATRKDKGVRKCQ